MESTVKYLWEASSFSSKNELLYHKIRSNFLNIALTTSKYNYKLNANLIGPQTRCQHCHTEWKFNKFSYTIPKTKPLSKASKRKLKLIVKNADGKISADQIKKAENRLFGKMMLIKCLVCAKVTKHLILKDSKTFKNKRKDQSFNSTLNDKNISKLSTKIDVKNTSKSNVKTPNKNITSTPKPEGFIHSKGRNRKLQQLCYLTPNQTPAKDKKKDLKNLTTPVVPAKKKRQRDKYAGLVKEACVASSTPKQKTTLQNLLRERNKDTS